LAEFPRPSSATSLCFFPYFLQVLTGGGYSPTLSNLVLSAFRAFSMHSTVLNALNPKQLSLPPPSVYLGSSE
jgi:hypothetical protein